jgi:hypothetical protein
VAADRRAVSLALLMILPALAVGCGSFGRPRDAYSQLAQDMQIREPSVRDPALARLRGAEPLLDGTWLASASAAGEAQKALDLVRRGRTYLPADSDLLLTELSILSQMSLWADEVQTARKDLGMDLPAGLRAQVLWFLEDGLIGQGQLNEAEDEVVRIGGVPGVVASMVCAAWVRLALARELAGQGDEADKALDKSLDLGAAGMDVLRHDSLTSADKKAAAGRLVERALVRQPDHPDLQLYRLVDRMAGGDLDGASQLLAALPAPLPERLTPQTTALRARLLLLQGKTEEGLDVLRNRLYEEPSDPWCLGVLLESYHVRGQPSAEETAAWLRAGRKRVADPALAAEIDATLKQIAALTPPKPDAAPPPADPPKP